MNWLFGSKKKKHVNIKNKIKLDKLEKLGYNDRVLNLELLKMYGGDVNLVIQDYTVQHPSSQSISTQQDPKPKKKSPKQEPKAAPKQQPKQSTQRPKAVPKQPKHAPKQEFTEHRNVREHRNMNGKKTHKPKPNDVEDKKEVLCYSYNHGGCKGQCNYVHKRYVDILSEYHNIYYKNNDVNVKNLGIYLRNSIVGYDKMRSRGDTGYIKYGTYARSFCEIVCNYMLKGASSGSLCQKIKRLSRDYPSFPQKEMDFIRTRCNIIVHGVKYNQKAQDRFIPIEDQDNILVNLYMITQWLNKEILSF
eukprot:811777_1